MGWCTSQFVIRDHCKACGSPVQDLAKKMSGRLDRMPLRAPVADLSGGTCASPSPAPFWTGHFGNL